ncbi:MAG: hypothetical protein FWD97_09970 [Defluviitaleaceae bacterium]|nr:hypothetical protein [Defluviitaleaceae bacterium]
MRNYFRQFIILNADRPSGHGRSATGRVVLEGRDNGGRATVYLQDAPAGVYRLVLFSKDERESFAADAGAVVIEDRGRFEGKFDFTRSDVAGSGFAVDDVAGVAIVQSSDLSQQADFSVALSGFRDTPYSWRVNLRFPQFVSGAEVEEIAHQEPEPIQEHIPAPEPILEPIPEPLTEPVHEPTPEPTPKCVVVEEVPRSVYSENITNFEHIHAHTQHPVPPEPKKPQSNPQLENFFASNKPVNIFDNHKPHFNWVAAGLFDLQTLGLGDDNLHRDPFVVGNVGKYRHVLIGQSKEGYALGVPDVLSCHTHQEGFDGFKLCQPDNPVQGSPGYWIKHF